jgi:hypothetical protein
MTEPEILDVPSASVHDVGRTLLIAGFGVIPVFGAVLQGVLDVSLPSPYERRVRRLLVELVKRVGRLQVEMCELGERPAFVSALALSAQDALTSDDDKINYLADALANVAARPDWLHDEVVTLMRHVGQLTASHIRVLELLRDPDVWAERQAVTYRAILRDGAYFQRDVIADAFEQLGHQRVEVQIVLQDLESRGLLNVIGLAEEDPHDALPHLVGLSSTLGNRIVDFVSWQPPAGQ